MLLAGLKVFKNNEIQGIGYKVCIKKGKNFYPVYHQNAGDVFELNKISIAKKNITIKNINLNIFVEYISAFHIFTQIKAARVFKNSIQKVNSKEVIILKILYKNITARGTKKHYFKTITNAITIVAKEILPLMVVN